MIFSAFLVVSMALALAGYSFARDAQTVADERAFSLRLFEKQLLFSKVISEVPPNFDAPIGPLLQDEEIVGAFVQHNRSLLYDNSLPYFRQYQQLFGLFQLSFIDSNGSFFLLVHRPDKFNMPASEVFQKVNATQFRARGLSIGVLSLLLPRIVTPFYYRGKMVGAVEIAVSLDSILPEFKKYGIDALVLVDKSLLNRRAWEESRAFYGQQADWDALDNFVLAGATVPLEDALSFQNPERRACYSPGQLAKVGDSPVVFGRFREGAGVVQCGGIPLRDVAGKRIGVVVFFEDVSDIAATAEAANLQTIVSVFFIGLVASFAGAFYVYKSITEPLVGLTRAIGSISRGKNDVRVPGKDRDDEIGELARAFDLVLISLKISMRKKPEE